ncbi:MAG: hypothetical protein WCS31_17300 [Verrucomicrobiae bacterium]
MKKLCILLLCLGVPLASAYQQAGFEVFIEVGYNKISLLNEENSQRGDSLRFSGPKLDNRWKDVRFAFMPEGDGAVCLRFGPGGESDIPAHYEDLRANGQPLEAKEWKFYPPNKEGARQGSIESANGEPVRLKVFSGAYVFIKVKKDERVEITMRVKSGSFLDALNTRLADVTLNLDDAGRIGVPLQGSGLDAGRKLAGELNRLSALSESKLHVSVSPLAPENVTLESLKAKTLEWTNAFEAEKARTANDERPCLYEQPADRTELKKLVISAVRQSTQVQTACLLDFLIKR